MELRTREGGTYSPFSMSTSAVSRSRAAFLDDVRLLMASTRTALSSSVGAGEAIARRDVGGGRGIPTESAGRDIPAVNQVSGRTHATPVTETREGHNLTPRGLFHSPQSLLSAQTLRTLVFQELVFPNACLHNGIAINEICEGYVLRHSGPILWLSAYR